MAKKATPAAKAAGKLQFHSWIETFDFGKELKVKNEMTGFVYFLGVDDSAKFASLIEEHGLAWQAKTLKQNDREVVYFAGSNGPVWILRPRKKASVGHDGLIDEAAYSWARDQFGTLVSQLKAHHLKAVQMEFHGTEGAQDLGALVGLDVAVYNFRQFVDGKQLTDLPKVALRKSLGSWDKAVVKDAMLRARAVNVARHMVNLPPNDLNPKSFAEMATKRLGFPKNTKVTVWDTKKLVSEKMGLHVAVGQGAENGPCMVHLKYRPAKRSALKPVAIVGKGITFDTGGLDIKPSSAMRLMKKDMGGAASVIALAQWAAESNYPGPLDFYLALAENAVDGKSFRPGDVITARSGMKVEIDNTDAEGRLVLADVLDVACTQKGTEEAELVIDVATLTGAIKVGLGAEIAGLFSNDDELAAALTKAGQRSGDLNWRMPLFEKYWGDLSSPFADCKNSGGGFGGAITAALFLQKFVRGKKWAHLDVYAWTDKAQGALLSSGGSGQPVQCLIEFLNSRLK
ncbi:M17 family metallopeptidase [Bdellovibrio bacteriovorus]|uniref:Cytosol aminopeptidase n=1 Tax=Bdellovibrio bacteriovorus str. Tiberius TaxID=1069642 RepID=K7YQM2_BDEBC|nr:leucyl aminopeptidase family protein [Bdellovibrio bacteriovorus]AFY02171.1 cytosol aminopeptidase [Bdellovibrio bacteriovorus str. Tiberius]